VLAHQGWYLLTFVPAHSLLSGPLGASRTLRVHLATVRRSQVAWSVALSPHSCRD